MILRNFRRMVRAIALGSKEESLKDTKGTSRVINYQNGSYYMCYEGISFHDMMTSVRTSLTAYPGVCFGDGDTPATEDDYTLSGNIITGITTTIATSKTGDDPERTITATYTITNNNSADITIREVLAYGRCYSSVSSSPYYYIAMDRTVLDTPLTIPAGGIGQVVYTITMTEPT